MPAKSEKQAIAARIARGIQKGEVKPKAGTASAEMAKMPSSSLKHFTKTEGCCLECNCNPCKCKSSKLTDIVREMNGQESSMTINGKQVDPESIEIDGIDHRDYPDFSDAYISSAAFVDGTPLSDDEVAQLDDQNYGLVNDKIHSDQLYLQESYDWRDDPAMSREWEKSDVSQDEFERYKGFRGAYQPRGMSFKGITFFNVPSGQEALAHQVGLSKFKSGKWGHKHVTLTPMTTDTQVLKRAEQEFGPGRYWEPKK